MVEKEDLVMLNIGLYEKSIITININPAKTIKDLKETIVNQTGISFDDMMLEFKKVSLEDKKPISFYIKEDLSTILLTSKKEFFIYILIFGGNELIIDTYPKQKIKDIKKKIERATDNTKDEMILLFNKTELQNNKTLFDYKINHEAKIELTSIKLQMNAPKPKPIPKPAAIVVKETEAVMIDKGINLSGVCNNPTCSLKGDTVYCNIKENCYDFVNETDKAKCPKCKTVFEVINCGFLKCIFTFEGKKMDPLTKKIHPIKIREFTKNEKYKTFEAGDSKNTVVWDELKVTVDTDKKTGDTGEPL